MIAQRTIDEIKSRMDIYEVVGDFVRLKKSGSSYKALSPFTNEKTPSFMVSPSKGIFKCFSSGKGGDAINFLQEVDGLSYVEALRYLAQKYGIQVEEDEVPENFAEEQNQRESLYIILNFAKEYYKENIHNSDEGKSVGLSYFKERGFSEGTINTFDLGYAFDKWDGLIQHAKENGHKEEFLEKAGLKIVKEEKQYDRFRGRVIFPIHNITGKVIAFGARILKTDKNQPKYINSPETDLYHKSNILYGIFQAKNAIRNEDNCYLVEGYTDVISLHQAGITNVVASSGTSLTEEQIKLIKRFSDNVTVLFDGDAAGLKASLRGIDMILAGGLNVKAVTFPEGEDPDSYAKALGDEEFKQFLSDNAQDFIGFKTSLFIEEGKNDPLKKAESIRELVQSISQIPDAIKRTVYIQECSNLMSIEESTLINELNKLLIKKGRDAQRKEERGSEYVNIGTGIDEIEKPEIRKGLFDEAIKNEEFECIRLLLNYGDKELKTDQDYAVNLVEYFLNESEDVSFTIPVYQKIFELFKSKLESGIVIDLHYLMELDDKEIKSEAVNMSLSRETSANWMDKNKIFIPEEKNDLRLEAYQKILRLKLRIISRMSFDVLQELKSTDKENEVIEIQKKMKALKQMETSLADLLNGYVVMR
ncbi:MAG: DNA primase [Cyclobacteriaceae bacterium]